MKDANKILSAYWMKHLEKQLTPSPFMEELYKDYAVRWHAKPWYAKAYLRLRARLYRARRKVGFWIAGHTPEDY